MTAATMNDFSVGDVVILKSGGPLMTVWAVGQDAEGRDAVDLIWWDESDNNYRNEAFPPGSLDKIDLMHPRWEFEREDESCRGRPQ